LDTQTFISKLLVDIIGYRWTYTNTYRITKQKHTVQ